MTAEDTEQRILKSALSLFLAQGLKRTRLDAVAHQAGVARVTVYRYFPDKKRLALAALMQVPSVLDEARARLARRPPAKVGEVLDHLGAQLAALPPGDFPALLEELKRVFPDVWRQVHLARRQSIQGLFDTLWALAERKGHLRPGLNRPVVQAYFMRAVVNVLDEPELVALGLSAAEVFQTVKAIFLHGLLKDR